MSPKVGQEVSINYGRLRSLSLSLSLSLSFSLSLSHSNSCRTYKPTGVVKGIPCTVGAGVEEFVFKEGGCGQCHEQCRPPILLVGKTVRIVGGGSLDCQVSAPADNLTYADKVASFNLFTHMLFMHGIVCYIVSPAEIIKNEERILMRESH